MADLDRAHYRSVVASRRWRDLRARLMRERGLKCERCQKTWGIPRLAALQLHHRTYERLGAEWDTDVQLLCGFCHEEADAERAIESRQRAASALYHARLDGWATKRYGENWSDSGENIADEFDNWLARTDD